MDWKRYGKIGELCGKMDIHESMAFSWSPASVPASLAFSSTLRPFLPASCPWSPDVEKKSIKFHFLELFLSNLFATSCSSSTSIGDPCPCLQHRLTDFQFNKNIF